MIRKLVVGAAAIVHNMVIFYEHLTFRTDHLARFDAVAYRRGLEGVRPVGFVDVNFRCLGNRCGIFT